MLARKPFKKVSDHNWVAGILGGIAYTFGLPVLLLRIAFIFFVFILSTPYTNYIGSTLFALYILIWIFGARWDFDPTDYEERTS